MPLRDTITRGDDQIMPINGPDRLISEPFVDSLARIQHEKKLAKQTAKDEAKRIRDQKLVATYLKSKFPDAFDKNTMTVPEKEFPILLRLAKRKYIRRITAGAMGVPAGIASFIAGLIVPTAFPLGAPLFLLGLVTIILSVIFTCWSVSTLQSGDD